MKEKSTKSQSVFGGFAVAAITAALAASPALASKDAAKKADKKATQGEFCQNNACKGNSSCEGHGNKNGCKGTNSCKGQGWINAADKAECEKDGKGKWTKG